MSLCIYGFRLSLIRGVMLRVWNSYSHAQERVVTPDRQPLHLFFCEKTNVWLVFTVSPIKENVERLDFQKQYKTFEINSFLPHLLLIFCYHKLVDGSRVFYGRFTLIWITQLNFYTLKRRSLWSNSTSATRRCREKCIRDRRWSLSDLVLSKSFTFSVLN